MFRNVYRLDNFLFLLGFVSLPVVLGMSLQVPLLMRPALWSVPICLFVVAFRIRREEKQILRIWRVLERAGSVSVQELQQLAEVPRPLIMKSIPLINRASGHVFLWDAKRDFVVDRARVRSLQIEAACEACGATVNENMEIEPGSGVACPYCSSPLLGHQQVLERLQATDTGEQSAPMGPSFNPKILVLLMMCFWPAGIWYLVTRSASRREAVLRHAL